MELKDQVCSLDLAKRLKELGVNQISIFCWSESETVPNGRDFRLYYKGTNNGGSDLDYSAFTSSELGEMLRKCITSHNLDYYFSQMTDISSKIWMIFYRNSLSSLRDCEAEDENETNCRAKILIHLIENGLIKI